MKLTLLHYYYYLFTLFITVDGFLPLVLRSNNNNNNNNNPSRCTTTTIISCNEKELDKASSPFASLMTDTASSNNNNNDDINTVQIFDNVFSESICEDELYWLASEHSERVKDGSIFFQNSTIKTPLEEALHSCLQQMDNYNSSSNNNIVEYWCRHEFINIDVHVDLDEQILLRSEESSISCPKFGHVLYVSIDESVRGPTCIFSKSNSWQNNNNDTITMIAVPAVTGRVLRFPGNAMHGVPKPYNRWWLNNNDLDNDDQNEADDDEPERAVILFNIWGENGPQGVYEDFASVIPDGIEIISSNNENDDDNQYYDEKADRLDQWHDEYGPNCRDLWCNDRSKWKQINIQHVQKECDDNQQNIIYVQLMGTKKRHQYSQPHVPLLTDNDGSFLKHKHQPTLVTLQPYCNHRKNDDDENK